MTSLILFILKENKRRILSWVCFICMLFNTLPVASFASEFEGDLTEPVEVVQDVMPDDNDPVVPAAHEPAEPIDSQDSSDPPADTVNDEDPAVVDQDNPQDAPAAEEADIIPDNSADITPDEGALEPDTNDIVPEGQDTPSAEEVVLPSLFIDFPATGVFSGDTLSVSYKYTSAKNEELVISLDNIALGLEVKYLSDEMPVETVRTEDEETGYAYYRLSALKDEVYLIRVFVEQADEEIPYSITITEYVEPSTDVEPDNTGDALIDIPPEITDNGTDETGDTTDTEPESNVVDIFPDLPNNEDTSAFDNFLNDNTEPVEETPAEENDEGEQEPAEDIVPVEPTNEEIPDENTDPVEPEGQVSEDTEEPVGEEPDVEPEDNNNEEDADNDAKDAEIPASEAGLPDILPDTEAEGNEAFDGFLVDNENNKEEPAEDSTTEEAPTDEVNVDEDADENVVEDTQGDEESPDDFLVTDDEEDGEEEPAPADETVDEPADEEAEEAAPEENEQPDEATEGEEESSEDATGEQDEVPTDKEESEFSDEDEATSDESESEDGEESSEDKDAEESEEEETFDLDEETSTVIDGVYTYTGHGMTVTVETTEENALPEGAEFVLAPVSADEERVQDYIAQAAELNGVDASAIIPYVYDMHFELEGEEVHIAEGSSVNVNIEFDNALDLGDVVAAPFYHIEGGKLVTLIQDVTQKEEVMPMRGAKGMMKSAPVKAEEKSDEDKSEEEEPKEENKTVESIDFTVGSFSDFMLTGVKGGSRSVDTYAILYSNGDLVFQLGNTPDETKGTIVNSWICVDGTTAREWASATYSSDIYRIYIDTSINFNGQSNFFGYLENLEYVYGINNVDLSNTNSLNALFYADQNLIHVYGLSSWDTHTITQLGAMFYHCYNLENINDIENWNLTLDNATGTISSTFSNCYQLENLDLSSWDLSAVRNTYYMFYKCNNLVSCDLGNIFTSAQGSIDMTSMFNECMKLVSVDSVLDDIPAGVSVNLQYAFQNCEQLTTVDLSGKTISSLSVTFNGCDNLSSVDLSNAIINGSANSSFSLCSNLVSLDLSNVTTANSSTIYNLSRAFYNTSSLLYLDLSSSYFAIGDKDSYTFQGSGITKVVLPNNFKFENSTLPIGFWERESTGDIYTNTELKSSWNTTMGDTYERALVITFDPAGGTVLPPKITKPLNETITAEDFPTVEKKGYTFVGWFTSPTGGQQLNAGDTVDHNTYYAHWTENTYTLVLNNNSDNLADTLEIRIPLSYTELYRLSPSVFQNDPFTIREWSTEYDGSGDSYASDQLVSMLTDVNNGEITLFANWDTIEYVTLTFDSQGGNDISPIILEKGSSITASQYIIPKRDGYTFDGWWTDPVDGDRMDDHTSVISSSQLLYAHWTRNPVVTFVPNGGWVSEMSRSVPYNGTLQVLPTGEDRIKKFKGFYTEQEYGHGTMLTADTHITEDVTYFAHWGYQPSFSLAGGAYSGTFDVDTVYPISENNILEISSLPSVVRDGYAFAGWKLADDTPVAIGDTIDLSLYPEIIADWSPVDTVTVHFSKEVIGGGSSSDTIKINGSTTYVMEKDTALGYMPFLDWVTSNNQMEFVGWFDANDVEYTRQSIVSTDVTLYPKFTGTTQNTYTFIVTEPGLRASGSRYDYVVNTSSYNTYIYRTTGEEIGELPGLEVVSGSLEGKYLEGWYSTSDPYYPDGTLKPGVEKLTKDKIVDQNLTWYAYIVNNVEDKYDGSISYKYFAEWVNASNTNVTNLDNNLDFHPQGYNDQTASLHVHFELNAEVSETLPTGSVRITVPKYIWKSWTNGNIGNVNISSQLSLFPNIAPGSFFSYALDANGNFVVLNNQPISGGAGVDFTFSYTVDPVLVRGGAVDLNKDYVEGYPYFTGQVPVKFEIDRDISTTYTIQNSMPVINDSFVPDIQESKTLTLEMHTYINPEIHKYTPSLITQWRPSWGDKPADADDYLYLYWQIQASYSGNQPFTLVLSEDTVHDGTVVYESRNYIDNPKHTFDTHGGSYSENYYVVTKHPKELFISVPATGLKLFNQARLTATTKSGYVYELIADSEYTYYKWDYTKGEFDKTNADYVNSTYSPFGYNQQSSSVNTYTAGQDKILNDEDIYLAWELHYTGVSADTPIVWDDNTQTYSRDQRVIAISDGINNDLMYSSGNASAKYVWEPTSGNHVLSDEDYTINKLRIFLTEYDAVCSNGEWGLLTKRTDYQLWKDIDIYVRYRNSNSLQYYTSVRPPEVNIKVNGVAYENYFRDVTLPDNVVGWEVRYPTKYFSTFLQVHMGVTLHATPTIKAYIQNDVNIGKTSIIKNRGYCNIWTSDNEMENPDTWEIRYLTSTFTEDTWSEPDIFFHVTDWTGGSNGATKEVWELNKDKAYLSVNKNASDHTKVIFDVERGTQEDLMTLMGWSDSGLLQPIKTGRFYDLLPRGATVDKTKIIGFVSDTYLPYLASAYSTIFTDPNANFTDFIRLPKEYYNVDFVQNWDNTGRTMMIIDFASVDTPKKYIYFIYKLQMTYLDVVSYGTSVQNDVALIDTTVGNSYVGAKTSIQTLENDAYAYYSIDTSNGVVAYAKAFTDYIPVDAYSWGFYKSVDTHAGYVQEDITIPNNIYTYKISYSQSDYASVNSMVFFDVLERGAYENPFHNNVIEKESEWYGIFDSVDVTPITTLKKTGTSDIYCAPVIYYSVKNRDQFDGSDWDVSNTSTWTTVMPPKEDITAIAVDCTIASDGSQFILAGRNSALFYINMRAPSDAANINKTAVNQAMFKATVNNVPNESSSDSEVTIVDEPPTIHKSSNPVSGTAEEPRLLYIGNALTYTIRVTNTNSQFDAPNVIVEDEIPEGLQVDTSAITVHFGTASNSINISESPRVSLTTSNQKLTFNIKTLQSNETCYIIIPCVVSSTAGGNVLENTATITEVNGIDKEIDSETTYHEVYQDISFKKQDQYSNYVPGASLQLYKVEEQVETLVTEWYSSSTEKIVHLRAGSYVLRESAAPAGYKIADDISFELLDDGTINYNNVTTSSEVMMIDECVTHVFGTKSWKYDDPDNRPSTVTLRLMRMVEGDASPVYTGDSITVSAQDDWEYDFGDLPRYDINGNDYIYSIEEVPVSGYVPYYYNSNITNGIEYKINENTRFSSGDKAFLFFYHLGKVYGMYLSNMRVSFAIPSTEFWIVFQTDGSDNNYGFKFDYIVPVQTDFTQMSTSIDRMQDNFLQTNFPWFTNETTLIEYSNDNYPESLHNYRSNTRIAMHYTLDMATGNIDVINIPQTVGFDIPINKINEDNEKIGGVGLKLSSAGEPGEPEIAPIEWTTVAGQSHIVHLYPGRYVLQETAVAAGYLYAEDLYFVIDGEGNVIIDETEHNSVDMLDRNINQPYPIKKIWADEGYEELRPSSVSFELVRRPDDVVVQTLTLTDADAVSSTEWVGAFDPVPVVDSNMDPIEYYSREVVVGNDYMPLSAEGNINGFWVTFSEDSYIGSAQLYVMPLNADPDTGTVRASNGYLKLNDRFGSWTLTEDDMAGQTYYVPRLDEYGTIGFYSDWDSSIVGNLRIVSITPTSEIMPYTLSQYSPLLDWTSIQNRTSGGSYPSICPPDYAYSNIIAGIWSYGYPISDSAFSGSVVTNVVNRHSISFEKIWSDEGHESRRPSTLTFDVYNINDPNTIVTTETITVTNARRYEIDNVPIYNPDGTIAKYEIKERAVNGYKSYNSPRNPSGFLVTFSSDSTAGSSGSGFNAGNSYMTAHAISEGYYLQNYIPLAYDYPDSYEYYFSTNKLAGKTIYIPVVDASNPGFLLNITDLSETAYIKIDRIVPVDYYTPVLPVESEWYYANYNYKSNNVCVFEGDEYPEVDFSESGWTSAAIVYNYKYTTNTVTNVYDKTKIDFVKEWSDYDYSTHSRPSEITIDIYNVNDLNTIVRTITIDKNTYQTSSDVWKYTIYDLPKYNNDWTLAQYKIIERPVQGYTTKAKKATGMLVTFSEDTYLGSESSLYSYIYMYSIKNGKCADGISLPYYSTYYGRDYSSYFQYGWIGDRTVYIPVYDDYAFAMYVNTDYNYMYNGTVKIESIQLTTDDYPFMGSASTSGSSVQNLRTYSGVNNIEIVNNSTLFDFVVVRYNGPTDYAYTDGKYTLINESVNINVPVNKTWNDVGYEDERPASVSFELYNLNDEETTLSTITLTSDNASSSYEWNGEFVGLPRYNNDGSEAKYGVREIEIEGYRTSTIKPTGMYITFDRSTLNLTPYYSANETKFRIFTVDTSTGTVLNSYKYPGVNDTDNTGYLTKENLKDLNYRVFLPIEKEGEYQFIIDWYRYAYSYSRTIVKSVELTTDNVPCSKAYYSGSPVSSFVNNSYLYTGHGECDMTGCQRYRYAYDGYDEIDAIMTGNITNEINKTHIDINKTWNDNGYENYRPESITLNIYNVNDDETIVETVTLNSANDSVDNTRWSKRVSGLPRYNIDGSLATYRVEEVAVPHYVAVTEKPKGMLVTLSEDSFNNGSATNTISFYSIYGNYTYQLIQNAGDSASIDASAFSNRANRTFYVPIVNDNQYEFVIYNSSSDESNILKIESVVLTSEEHAYTGSLNSNYTSPVSNMHYTGHAGVDISGKQGYFRYIYDQTYPVGNITNEINITSIPVIKNWDDEGYEDHRPDEIVIDIYNVRDRENIVKTVTMTASDSDGEYTWRTIANDLPMYNTDLSLAEYVIKEHPTTDYLAKYNKPVGMLVTISSDTFLASPYVGNFTLYSLNKPSSTFKSSIGYEITEGTITRNIYQSDLAKQRTFYVPIEDDGYYAFGIYLYRQTVNSSSDPVRESEFKIEKVQLTTVEQPYTASSMGMPIYSVPANHIYTGDGSLWDVPDNGGYYVYIYDGPESDIGSAVQYGIDNTVTNAYNKTSFEFEKRWDDNGYTEMRPDSLVFQVYNERTPNDIIQEKTVYRSESESGNVWHYIFDDLPQYNPDGSLAVYLTKEKSIPTGYTSISANKDIKGFILKFSDDTDLSGGTLIIYQFDGEKLVNAVAPSLTAGPPYWYGTYYPIAGKSVYVPVHTPGLYEFGIYLYRSQASYNTLYKASYTIESITPVYEEMPALLHTGFVGPQEATKVEYNNQKLYMYEIVENARTLSRNVGVNNGYTDIYTFYKYTAPADYNGISNTLQKFPVVINKRSADQEYLSGAHLQLLKSDKNTIIDQWDTVADSNHSVTLPCGTYYIRETVAPQGYELAEDLEFVVSPGGIISVLSVESPGEYEDVTIVSMYDDVTTNITFDKYWSDTGFASYRPASAIYDLYDSLDMNTIIDTVTLTSADMAGSDTDHWQGIFNDLPTCHVDGSEIQYVIRERDVRCYNVEYAGERLAVNTADSYSYTPLYGMTINWSADARTNGPLCVIWKDNRSGRWYYTGNGVSTTNVSWNIDTQEVYLLYKSYGYYPGIAIDSIAPYIGNTYTITPGSNYSSNSFDRDTAIAELASTYSTSYWPQNLTSSDFTDGSNGYRDNIASTNYNGENAIQLVKLALPLSTGTIVTKGATGKEILDAEGFRITTGYDYCTDYGPVAVLWRNTATGKLAARGGSLSPSTAYDIPSKEFYIMYVEYNNSVIGSGVTLQSVKPIADSSNWITATYSDEYDTIEDFMNANYSSVTPAYIDGRYGVSAGTSNSKATVFSFVYSAQYESITSDDPFVDDFTITNTFDHHPWQVPITKVNVLNVPVTGAHLKLFNAADNSLINEWDTSSTPHIETLWDGTYILKETSVPAGYLQASDITFTVNPVGDITVSNVVVSSINMVDTADPHLTINKVDYDNQNTNLSGAVLKLYSAADVLLYTWTTDGTAKDITTYLSPGNIYKIKETHAPSGYNVMSEDISLQVALDGTITITETEWATLTGSLTAGYTLTLYNNLGVVFPATGASDRTWVYLGSVMILLASAALLIRRKRRRNNA